MAVLSSNIVDEKENKLEQARQAAANAGFRPTSFVDLPGDIPPVVNAPRLQDERPAGLDDDLASYLAPEVTKKVEREEKPELTNQSALVESATFTFVTAGQRSYIEAIGSSPPDGYQRLDNICGAIPYAHGDFFIRPITFKDLRLITRALQGQSSIALNDALSATVKVPCGSYRNLTVADHYSIMYWHLIEAYKPVALDIKWTSELYGVTTNAQIKHTTITSNPLAITPADYKQFSAKGFTIPRMYDLELGELVGGLETEEAQDLYSVLDILTWLDPEHAAIVPFVQAEKAAGSVNAAVTGRMKYLETVSVKQIMSDLEDFKTALGEFGLEESFLAAADISYTYALKYLSNLDNPTPAQVAELTRIKIVGKQDFTPIEEESKYVRPTWRFFLYGR